MKDPVTKEELPFSQDENMMRWGNQAPKQERQTKVEFAGSNLRAEIRICKFLTSWRYTAQIRIPHDLSYNSETGKLLRPITYRWMTVFECSTRDYMSRWCNAWLQRELPLPEDKDE